MPMRQRSCLICNKRFFLNSPSQKLCSKRCKAERHRQHNRKWRLASTKRYDLHKKVTQPTQQEVVVDTGDLIRMRAYLKRVDRDFKLAIKEGRFEDASYSPTTIPIRSTCQKTLYELREEFQRTEIHKTVRPLQGTRS